MCRSRPFSAALPPLLVFLFPWYPFLYFSTALASIVLSLPAASAAITTVLLVSYLTPFLFILFGRSASEEDAPDSPDNPAES